MSTTVDILFAAASLAFPPEAPEVLEDEKEEPAAKPEEDEEMQESRQTQKRHQELRAQAEVRSAQKHRKPLP